MNIHCHVPLLDNLLQSLAIYKTNNTAPQVGIQQVRVTDWLIMAHNSRCTEASKSQPPLLVLVPLVTHQQMGEDYLVITWSTVIRSTII
jgi:hypothetical protein